jgi:hypothetical protein
MNARGSDPARVIHAFKVYKIQRFDVDEWNIDVVRASSLDGVN